MLRLRGRRSCIRKKDFYESSGTPRLEFTWLKDYSLRLVHKQKLYFFFDLFKFWHVYVNI